MAKNEEHAASQRRVTVLFEGHVQGVGFRFTTLNVARRHPVTGYVRNEPDGSVRLVAEGAEDSVLRFLDELRRSPVYRYVRNERVHWGVATGEFPDFDIRYG
jgi:acylphosphatase